MAKLDYDALNSTVRYLMFSVFSVEPGELGDERAGIVDETATFLKQQEDKGVVVRGIYDIAGMRADADFMFWTHAETVEALQATYWISPHDHVGSSERSRVEQRRVASARRIQQEPHSGIPGRRGSRRVRVCLSVRAVAGVVPTARRRASQDAGRTRHGRAGVQGRPREHGARFRAGDYEWILAFEAPELYRIVDLMRELRATDARRHTREETPFFTGPRVSVEELVTRLP